MSVKNEHVNYVAMKAEWQKCLDFATSRKAVHAQGELYLSRLSEQTDTEYGAYKSRSPVMMFMQRAGFAMTGMVGRKDSYIEGAETIQPLLDSVDSRENNYEVYQSNLVLRFLYTGRAATLTDMPAINGLMTKLEAEETGVRPRFIYYNEMNLINWREKMVNNVMTLVLVVLREEVDSVDDEFNWKVEYRYRVLDLVGDGYYRQRIFNDDGSEVPGSQIFPKENGQFMRKIPIEIHGGVSPITPPLNSICDLNLCHYQLGADEIYGLRMAALPTPYFFGADPTDDDFPSYVGPGRVIGSSETDCRTGFREFTGAGMEAVARKMQKFEDQIAMLSVQMATDRLNSSATGSAIDYANATATLAGVVTMLNHELNTSLKTLARWSGNDPELVNLSMNKDFMPAGMDANTLLALLKMYLSGTITYETYYRNIAQGEYANPQTSSAQELGEIKANPPMGFVPAVPLGETGDVKVDSSDTGDALDPNAV